MRRRNKVHHFESEPHKRLPSGAAGHLDESRTLHYFRAKAFLADRYPGRLAAFESAMDPLRTRPDFDVQLPERFFTAAQAGLIRKALREVGTAQLESHELGAHGRFVVHDHPDLVGLQTVAAGALGELVGEKVDPAYSFIALYNRNGKCPVHLDAPVSKWTLDYCIEQSEPWPIHFSEVVAWPENFEFGHGMIEMVAEPGL